jgi:hypothetical protein
MRKVIKNTVQAKKYFKTLPKLYSIFLWAKWGILELPWSGKYNRDGISLVYIYRDRNGECDEYYLDTINNASSGGFWGWYENKDIAEGVQEKLNEALKQGEIGYDEFRES